MHGTEKALQDEGFTCYSYEVDIADKEQVYQMAKRVKQEVGQVNILINNAGIVTCRTLLDLPDKAIENTYNVNILSHYWVSLEVCGRLYYSYGIPLPIALYYRWSFSKINFNVCDKH